MPCAGVLPDVVTASHAVGYLPPGPGVPHYRFIPPEGKVHSLLEGRFTCAVCKVMLNDVQ